MQFQKFQAVGNDFLIVREADLPGNFEVEELARTVCERHRGPGADGLEVLLTDHTAADFAIRIFNADGGETPISGNGTRCIAAYLYFNDLWDAPVVRVKTGAGIKTLWLRERSARRFVFETDMGVPQLSSAQIPIQLPEPLETVVRQRLQVGDVDLEFTSSSMGNPHCSLIVNDLETTDWRALGSMIETHPAFPLRTNVEFIQVIDPERIAVRFWERGVGPTLSSGTGSCAAAIAAILNEKTSRRVTVGTEGGELLVEWREDGHIFQTGEVHAVYRGELLHY
ncbi:MAG: diaminopimelate epimerase [Acidobacteriota bacterium]